jgi:hypothetical protein
VPCYQPCKCTYMSTHLQQPEGSKPCQCTDVHRDLLLLLWWLWLLVCGRRGWCCWWWYERVDKDQLCTNTSWRAGKQTVWPLVRLLLLS